MLHWIYFTFYNQHLINDIRSIPCRKDGCINFSKMFGTQNIMLIVIQNEANIPHCQNRSNIQFEKHKTKVKL